jgi:hypothetical protein
VACSHWLSNVTEWCSLGGFGFHPEYVGRPHPVVVSIGQQQRGSERRKGGEREGSRRGVGRREDREAPATASVAVLLDGGVRVGPGMSKERGSGQAEEEQGCAGESRAQGGGAAPALLGRAAEARSSAAARRCSSGSRLAGTSAAAASAGRGHGDGGRSAAR